MFNTHTSPAMCGTNGGRRPLGGLSFNVEAFYNNIRTQLKTPSGRQCPGGIDLINYTLSHSGVRFAFELLDAGKQTATPTMQQTTTPTLNQEGRPWALGSASIGSPGKRGASPPPLCTVGLVPTSGAAVTTSASRKVRICSAVTRQHPPMPSAPARCMPRACEPSRTASPSTPCQQRLSRRESHTSPEFGYARRRVPGER